MLKFRHLVFNHISVLSRRATRRLLLGNDGRVDIEMVTDEGRVDPGSIAGVLGKHIDVSFEELNQFLLLLKRQLSPYPKEFLRIAAYNYFFQVFAFRLIGGCVRGQSRDL